jgi:protein involved in polysaccharide export with SLBB domain
MTVLLANGRAVLAQNASPDYLLGTGDLLTVAVARHPEMSAEEVPVNAAGRVSLPVIGSIDVGGKTVAQVTREIRTKLLVALRRPEVTVTLKQARSRSISVLGSVGNPGVYDLKPGWRVADALAAAGGLTARAEIVEGVLARNNETALPLDIPTILRDPGNVSNMVLASGDTLNIAARTVQVSVLGAVQKPGAVGLEQKGSLRLTDALALAGGLSVAPGAARIVITRMQADGSPRTWSISGAALLEQNDQTLNEVLQEGDLVSIVGINRKVYISGEVKTPGAYELREGDSIPKLIALAGGTTETAALTRVAVQRAGQTIPVDTQAAFRQGAPLDFPLQDGDFVVVPKNTAQVLVLGAVNQPGAISIEENTTLRIGDAIGKTGGVKDRAKLKEIGIFRSGPNGVQRQVISLDRMYNGQPGLNYPLQSGDTLYVPEGQQSTSFWDQIARVVTLFSIFG